MTLYRLAVRSQVVDALVEAAENGKEVVVLVELRARFDEESNIEYSRKLEEAGCRVIYGLNGFKVHSKLCLITRKTDKGLEYITQIGTGNYNEKTSTLYTDITSILRSDMPAQAQISKASFHLPGTKLLPKQTKLPYVRTEKNNHEALLPEGVHLYSHHMVLSVLQDFSRQYCKVIHLLLKQPP